MRRQMLALSACLASIALIACGSDTGGNGGAGGETTTTTTTTGSTSTTSTTSSTSTTSTTSSTSTTTTTTTAGGQCTNTADLGIIQDPAKDVQGKVGKCGQDNLGQEPATKNCIVMQTGLTDPCAQCFSDTVGCAVMKCFSQCVADPSSQMCTDCRKTNCDPAFYACSGLPQN